MGNKDNYAVALRPSVRLLQAGIVQKCPNVGSLKQRRTIAQGLYFSGAI